MLKREIKSLRGRQDGFASLVVGLILIVVLALLTVGFAQLSRHEGQQALSSQLATQAYYAAETGINDAYNDMTTLNPGDPSGRNYINSTNASGTSCMDMSSVTGAKTSKATLSSANGTSYSCLLVDLNTPDLQYDVEAGSGQTVVTSVSSRVSGLKISWGSKDTPPHTTYQPSLTATGGFKPTAAWGNAPGVIQISVTPLTSLTRTGLTSNTFTAFLYPASSTGDASSVSYAPPGGGNAVISGHCGNNPGAVEPCVATIANINSNGPFLIHIISLYDASHVVIADSGASGVTFNGGQAVIDVTGKARNVLKRLQVRVKLNSAVDLTDYAIAAKDICKRMATGIGSTIFYDTASNQITDPASTDPCQIDSNVSPPPPLSDPTGAAAIQGCVQNCTANGNPHPGAYGWSKTFTNVSPAGQVVLSCLWNFGDGRTATTACQPGQTVTNDFSHLVNLATFPAYDAGCHSISLTATLTLHLANGKNPVTTKKFNVPSCYATP